VFAFTDLCEKLAEYLSEESVNLVSTAYAVADKAHEGQKRFTGEPYITHPLEVARILANMHMDAECIAAAILHDTIEDTDLSKEQISDQFGEKVAELVDGVSKLKQIRFQSRKYQQAENFRKMMLAMAQDIRVILIKLADRLHNMRTLGTLPAEKKRRVALETLEIYAPIAHRLGMNHMRTEFEELGFKARYPFRYRVLKNAVHNVRKSQKRLINNIERKFEASFKNTPIKNIKIWGREKHLYSLYRKMREKRSAFSNITDVYAFRIIVPNEFECYQALGLVHRCFPPMPSRFKDYIAMPKPNGYQSLHTTLIGQHGVPIEVQIRDVQMDKIAENGIASHWLYKNPSDDNYSKAQQEAEKWLSSLMEIQKKAGSPLEFIENVKIDLYPDEIYVFTPKGNIMALPQGATVVDFAYSVHTDVGNSCVGCKIDRQISGLSTRLRSGQTVEVMTAQGAHPNPSWLNFTVTGKARSSVRHWVKNQERSESQDLGRRLVNGILAGQGLSLDAFKSSTIQCIVKEMGLQTEQELLEDIGLGKSIAQTVVERLLQENIEKVVEKAEPEPLIIKGSEGLVLKYASCCYPIPGDIVLGHLSPGTGIVVHRDACPKIEKWKKHPDKIIELNWDKDLDGEFQVPIYVDVLNGRGVLAELAMSVSEAGANITNVSVDPHDGVHNTVIFYVTIKNRSHLARIVRRLRNVTEVIKVNRN
jgi:guanosine-3',5'-bis(diphosphate) 3'-pyrophosphohydrolase